MFILTKTANISKKYNKHMKSAKQGDGAETLNQVDLTLLLSFGQGRRKGGKKEGRKEGTNEGKKEGRKEGRKEWRKEGKKEG